MSMRHESALEFHEGRSSGSHDSGGFQHFIILFHSKFYTEVRVLMRHYKRQELDIVCRLQLKRGFVFFLEKFLQHLCEANTGRNRHLFEMTFVNGMGRI